jgi:CxxC motif-containing protein (DUF1111 family)
MTGKFTVCLGIAIAIGVMVSCKKMLPAEPDSAEVLGLPIEGLTPEQLRNHVKGDEEFGRNFSVVDGLGPIFVSASCESCHAGDGKGHPLTTLTRFNKFDGTTHDPMLYAGGPQLQHRSISGYLGEKMPKEATGFSKFNPPAVSGFGLLEAIPDADLIALADANDANGDGISGVLSYIEPPDFFKARQWHIPLNGKYIGRFGKKAGAIDLLHQTANAYLQDMGITSDFHLEDLYNVQAGNFSGDDVADPEVSGSIVRNVVFYMRTLKAPSRRNEDEPAVIEGEKVFARIGCNSCHKKSFTTAQNDIEALSNKTFFPWSDLLLHDMGPELNDNYTEGSATMSEWRTAPLWGLGLAEFSQGGSAFYLHDGRATTLEAAIEFHGGEASGSRTKFRQLSTAERENLMMFLKSL